MMTAAALTAMSCGDGRNSARENEGDDMDNTELAEPDTTTMESDTTSNMNMDQRQDDGTTDDNALDNSDTESRNQRDTIQ